MAEYIEREKVYDMLNAALNETDKLDGLFSGDYIRGCKNTLSIVTNDIQKTPSADVRPERHGKWVSWEEAGNYIPSPNRHECSVCHDCAQFLVNGIELLSSYCPNCGAKMYRGEENG